MFWSNEVKPKPEMKNSDFIFFVVACILLIIMTLYKNVKKNINFNSIIGLNDVND